MKSSVLLLAALAAFLIVEPSEAAEPIGVCRGGNRAARHATCIYDGDTGWQYGIKWRLLDIDAPELSGAVCQREHDLGVASRDRLVALMANGYAIRWSGRADRIGRALVTIHLANGDDAGQRLIADSLAQPWPNRDNVWCRR